MHEDERLSRCVCYHSCAMRVIRYFLKRISLEEVLFYSNDDDVCVAFAITLNHLAINIFFPGGRQPIGIWQVPFLCSFRDAFMYVRVTFSYFLLFYSLAIAMNAFLYVFVLNVFSIINLGLMTDWHSIRFDYINCVSTQVHPLVWHVWDEIATNRSTYTNSDSLNWASFLKLSLEFKNKILAVQVSSFFHNSSATKQPLSDIIIKFIDLSN